MIHRIKRTIFSFSRRHLLCKKQNNKNKTHLLVACMPKSGSTYLSTILSNLKGFTQTDLTRAGGRREQELDILELMHNDDKNYVAQHHVKLSRGTQSLIDQFDLKPIVLVRNLHDVIVSFRDHFRNESIENSLGYVFPYMKDWPNDKLESFIVDIFTPWYINFFLSWKESNNLCLITYEELTENPLETICKINQHYSLGLNLHDITNAIALADNRFVRKNVGKPGRGAQLNDYCKQHINIIASYYDQADLSMIGI
jgi:hypothetical protein